MIPGGAGENGAYNVDQVIASCSAGQTIIGASIGFASNAGANQELFIRDSLRLTSTTWLVQGGNDSGTTPLFWRGRCASARSAGAGLRSHRISTRMGDTGRTLLCPLRELFRSARFLSLDRHVPSKESLSAGRGRGKGVMPS